MDERLIDWIKGVWTRVERDGGWEIWLWLSRLYGATTRINTRLADTEFNNDYITINDLYHFYE